MTDTVRADSAKTDSLVAAANCVSGVLARGASQLVNDLLKKFEEEYTKVLWGLAMASTTYQKGLQSWTDYEPKTR